MALHQKILEWWWNTFSVTCLGVFARMPNPLKTTEKIAMCKFISSQLVSGNWPLIYDFSHWGLQVLGNSLTGWIQKTNTIINAPIFTPGVGLTFNGTTQYLGTSWNLSVDAIPQNDALLGSFVTSYTAGGANAALISNSDTMTMLKDNVGINKLQFAINGDGTYGSPLATFDNNSLYCMERTNNTNSRLRKNGVTIKSDANVSSVPLNAEILISRRSGSSEYFKGQLSSFIISKSLGFNYVNFYDNLVILNTDLAAV